MVASLENSQEVPLKTTVQAPFELASPPRRKKQHTSTQKRGPGCEFRAGCSQQPNSTATQRPIKCHWTNRRDEFTSGAVRRNKVPATRSHMDKSPKQSRGWFHVWSVQNWPTYTQKAQQWWPGEGDPGGDGWRTGFFLEPWYSKINMANTCTTLNMPKASKLHILNEWTT